jgi:hypothetical protein
MTIKYIEKITFKAIDLIDGYSILDWVVGCELD